MYKFTWQGNSGYFSPDPGKVEKEKCGICGTQMNVKRNIRGPTGMAEAMSGRGGHLHDSFTCPHFSEEWHKRIDNLAREAYSRVYHIDNKDETKEIKKALKKKVKKILKKAAKK